jgi:ABC-type sugar transport system permease subunit
MESTLKRPEGLQTTAPSLGARLEHFVDRRIHVIYPAPAVILLVALFVIPILYTIYLSFHSWNFSPTRPPVFIGVENYLELIQEARFHRAIINTFYYVLLASPL